MRLKSSNAKQRVRTANRLLRDDLIGNFPDHDLSGSNHRSSSCLPASIFGATHLSGVITDCGDIAASSTAEGTCPRFRQDNQEVTLTLSDADCEVLLDRYRDRSGTHASTAGEKNDLSEMTIDEMLAAMDPADDEAFVAAFDTSDEKYT